MLLAAPGAFEVRRERVRSPSLGPEVQRFEGLNGLPAGRYLNDCGALKSLTALYGSIGGSNRCAFPSSRQTAALAPCALGLVPSSLAPRALRLRRQANRKRAKLV